jgi:hypothetical protein
MITIAAIPIFHVHLDRARGERASSGSASIALLFTLD